MGEISEINGLDVPVVFEDYLKRYNKSVSKLMVSYQKAMDRTMEAYNAKIEEMMEAYLNKLEKQIEDELASGSLIDTFKNELNKE